MSYSTTNTYSLKRDILNFSNKISSDLSRPDQKFSADITYGLLAAKSCLLTDVVDQLHEPSRKINIVDRLSRHLNNGIPDVSLYSYLDLIQQWVPRSPVILIDDSDVVKPRGRKFESLCRVRDGSESTSTKSVYKNGYHVTEAVALTHNGHPVSFFSNVYSSTEKEFISTNAVTFRAMERGRDLFGKAILYMDKSYRVA